MRKLRILLPVAASLVLLADVGAAEPKTKTLRPAEVGQCAPDFKLRDHSGDPVKLSSFRGKQHVVLVFYRGSF